MEFVKEVVAKLSGSQEDIERKKRILGLVVDGLARGGKEQIQAALRIDRQSIDDEFSALLSTIRRML